MTDVVPTLLSGGIVSQALLSGGRVTRTGISGGQVLRTDLSGGAAPVYVAPAYPMADFGDYYFPATNLTLADADPVDSWLCAITGVALTQATPTQRPSYVANRLGFPAIQGDKVDDFLMSEDVGLALTGASASTDYAIVVVSSSFGAIDRALAATGNASGTRRLAVTARNAGQYRYAWATSGGGVGLANGTGRPSADMDAVVTSVSGGNLRQEGLAGLLTVAVTAGDWECDRFTVCARDGGAAFSDAFIHAVLVAKGAKALALFNDPSALFAAVEDEWGPL